MDENELPPPGQLPESEGNVDIEAETNESVETSKGNSAVLKKLQEYSSHRFKEQEEIDLPPVEDEYRKCTNLFCLIVFGAYWFVIFVIAILAYARGDPNLLLYGTDNEGRICGVGELEDRRFLAIPRFGVDLQETIDAGEAPDLSFFGVCRERCPSVGELICSDGAEEIVQERIEVSGENREEIINECIDPFGVSGTGDGCISPVVANECFETLFNSTSFLFRCFPEFVLEIELLEGESGCTKFQNYTDVFGRLRTKCLRLKTVEKVTKEEPTEIDTISELFNTVRQRVQELVGDIVQSGSIITGTGMLAPFVSGFVYICLLGLIVAPVVYMTLGLLVFSSLALTLYFYSLAGVVTAEDVGEFLQNFNINVTSGEGNDIIESVPSVSEDFDDQFRVLAHMFVAITILLFIIVLAMLPQIRRAIDIFEEASHVLRSNTFLLLIPLASASVSLINISFFIFTVPFILSIGEIEIRQLNGGNQTTDFVDNFAATGFNADSYTPHLAFFSFFGFVWTSFFIVGVSTMIISHVVAQSYWSTEDGSFFYKRGSLRWAIKAVLRFHLGTVAFGSLLIAIVRIVRYIAAFVDARTKKLQDSNRVLRYFLKSVHCCLFCAEKLIKFASKNAYIMTAMYGTSFCKSSKMAFYAIAKNILQVGTVTFLGEVILRLGQLFITILCGFIAFELLENERQDIESGLELSSIVAPLIVVLILAWVISGAILNVYDVAVDTMLLSYCHDGDRLALRGHEMLARDHEHVKRRGTDETSTPGDGNLSVKTRKSPRFGMLMESHKRSEEELLKRKNLFAF